MLTTVESVITALGGTGAVATLTGFGPTAVSNWKARGRIPSEQFLIVTNALTTRNLAADPKVFGFAEPEKQAVPG